MAAKCIKAERMSKYQVSKVSSQQQHCLLQPLSLCPLFVIMNEALLVPELTTFRSSCPRRSRLLPVWLYQDYKTAVARGPAAGGGLEVWHANLENFWGKKTEEKKSAILRPNADSNSCTPASQSRMLPPSHPAANIQITVLYRHYNKYCLVQWHRLQD